MNITLPWPPSALNPNQRTHWRKHAAAKKAYRAACAWNATSQGVGGLKAEKLLVALQFRSAPA
jgi:crossover junction endodeoxyribonuclease RusA